MENEAENLLVSSSEKLSNLLTDTTNKNEAVLQYIKNVNYPPIKDFHAGLEWFNVSEPLSFSNHLKGKVVILDFFTYCCVNCMHILPDLKEIENEFSIEDGLVVIGVHSAKFENEKSSSNIVAAVQRYNISHPVVNDANLVMWKECDVYSWPTLVMIGPNFNTIVMLVGEGHKEELRLYIRNALNYYKSRNEISKHKLPLKSAYHLLPTLKGPLLFPGKIGNFLDENNSELLAITDSGNHRILIAKSDGRIIKQIGGRKEGFKDGTLETAEFRAPQGITFRNKDVLFVADTENHAIREINLKENYVKTVAGNGQQGFDMVGGNIGKKQILSSPWDLCIYKAHDVGAVNSSQCKDVLIIAMAGNHQIWALFLDEVIWWKSKKYIAGSCVSIAGSGNEENRNNQYPHRAAFAQPSGLALCNKKHEIYIADSESSSVRRLSLLDGKVTAVVGADRNPSNLFAYGDKDGALYEAKLQHALGVALSQDEDTLYVADTYNHKLKKVNISQNIVQTMCGSKAGDAVDGQFAMFNEPAGLCVGCSNNRLYISDTNNHCIKVVSLAANGTVKQITKLDLNFDSSCTTQSMDKSNMDIVNNKAVNVNMTGGKIVLKIRLNFKEGLTLTKDAPQKWCVDLPDPSWSCIQSSGKNVESIEAILNIPASDKNENVDFVLNLYTCTDDSCTPRSFVVRQPINFSKEGFQEIDTNIDISVQSTHITMQ